MRTASEINKQLESICAKHSDNETAAVVAQALAWVLGDELSALDMLNEEA